MARPSGTEIASQDPLTVLMIGALPLDLSQVKGGVQAVIVNLFHGFREIPGIRIVHVAFTRETSTSMKVQFAENITIHFLPYAVNNELLDYVVNDKAFRDILEKEQPHIIHIQEISPHIIRLLKYSKENIVVTQHGIMHEELKYASGISQKLKGIFKAGVERFIFPVFRHVIFISNYNEKLYPAQAVHAAQIFNPVNPIFFTEDAQRFEGERNTIAYVGVLSRRKNIRIVIEALYQLKKEGKEFKLHVMGGYKNGDYEDEINSLVEDYKLSDQIIFHGWVSHEKIREIYSKCPIFILPSQQETLPVSIGEAMALGKVVIAPDVGAIREMFSDCRSGFLFRKNDNADLVRILKFVYDNPDLPEIGRRARQEALEKFHPKLIAEKTFHFYSEVMTNLTARAPR